MAKFFQQGFDAFAQNSLTCSEQSLVIQSMPVMRYQQGWNVKSFVSVSEKDV